MLKDDFETFCSNIELDNLEEMKTTIKEITKKLNKYYYDTEDKEKHMYTVGSVGRGTAIKNTSDLGILFDLPSEVYTQYDNYENNGQSALLQDVKKVLLERYQNTKIKGDGQVVDISFNEYKVELVPGFKQNDERFKYPDSNDGGHWRYTDPLPEIEACKNSNDDNGKFMKKAKKAYNKFKDVNENDENINEVLRGIFGNEFPKNEKRQMVEENLISYRNTEQFIEDRFVVDIQYNLELECTVTQNGYRPAKLGEMLRNKVIVMPKKQLEFYIKNIENFEKLKPYSIFWKIKNEGETAKKKDMIRGQLLETNSYIHKEHTDFRDNHYVEAYIIKEDICIAKERMEVPIRENTEL